EPAAPAAPPAEPAQAAPAQDSAAPAPTPDPSAAPSPAPVTDLAGVLGTMPASPYPMSYPGMPALPASAPETDPEARMSTPAAEEPSEGAALAATLPLGDLGHDVEVIVSKRSISFRINSEILFETGQADLSRPGLSVLQRMAKVLADAGYDITVEGHTDAVPVRRNARYPSNWERSRARAGSVVGYLQANGLGQEQLQAGGDRDGRP